MEFTPSIYNSKSHGYLSSSTKSNQSHVGLQSQVEFQDEYENKSPSPREKRSNSSRPPPNDKSSKTRSPSSI